MTVQASARRGPLRRIYDWCIEAADRPRALWTMGAVAFAESSFFPVPPDVMLIPMALARPQRAYVMAAWCTAMSVAGGLLGYAIGALLYDSVGVWLIRFYGYSDKVEAFRLAYAQWGAWIILLKGLTPIPYKVVTITSGFAGYNLGLFILFSVISRGARFFVVALLLHRYGERARHMIEKRLGLWVSLGTVVIMLGIAAALYLF
ncbi:MAG: DedA family protein [Pseudolabrys sp.]|nr:DedA family protein [Pseudolabrys sp.]